MAAKSASSLFIEGMKQIARGLQNRQRGRGRPDDNDQISDIASALMKKQAEHEERKSKDLPNNCKRSKDQQKSMISFI
jgi:hypothetical protein